MIVRHLVNRRCAKFQASGTLIDHYLRYHCDILPCVVQALLVSCAAALNASSWLAALAAAGSSGSSSNNLNTGIVVSPKQRGLMWQVAMEGLYHTLAVSKQAVGHFKCWQAGFALHMAQVLASSAAVLQSCA
jgi:hypothetical protein